MGVFGEKPMEIVRISPHAVGRKAALCCIENSVCHMPTISYAESLS